MAIYNMCGVQFLTDNLGNKTAAIVDLKNHRDFWADVLAECGEPTDFQFLYQFLLYRNDETTEDTEDTEKGKREMNNTDLILVESQG